MCSFITVKYVGRLTNGSIFDQTQGADTFSSYLGNLIRGWVNAVPYIKTGGKIRLFIPPSLGYGSANQTSGGVVTIPGNSILIFDIELVNVR
jgi:FKBP-type peptidyl-prolyl cis-trans isomerase FkpA